LLRVKDITLPRLGGGFLLDHVSLEVHAGEILGLYGLMGAGRTELTEVLAGVRPEATGEVWLDGDRLENADVADRIDAGVVLVPEDRKTDGLVPSLSVAHNMVLASLKRYLNGLYLSRGKERSAVDQMVKDLSVRVADPNHSIQSLSGGNQQKVVVAKGLLTEPKVLILDEPTRGIDVGAKSEIFEIMNRLATEGYGILFVSSELKEVMAMSDRIVVLSKGAIVAEFAGQAATEEELVAASAVGHGPAATRASEPIDAATVEVKQ
jgi:erythritol transport system ATP-binding protein